MMKIKTKDILKLTAGICATGILIYWVIDAGQRKEVVGVFFAAFILGCIFGWFACSRTHNE